MEEVVEEGRQFATFERHGEFADLQATLLSLDINSTPTAEEEKNESALFRRLSDILDEYQEQAYLLDPFLEQLVGPVVAAVKHHAQNNPQNADPGRIERVGMLLYSYVKSRGYKTIIRFFPHEIADLAIARACMDGVASDQCQWALRYVVLLWLALICMIPFDLAQFDECAEGETADALEGLARPLLGRAGRERDGAALLLARFYTRQDTRSRFHAFLDWVDQCVSAPADSLTLTGILQVLCELASSGPSDLVQSSTARFFKIADAIQANASLNSNTILRKFRTKLIARIPLRILAPSMALRRKGKALMSDAPSEAQTIQEEEEIDVPEEVETVLEQLFESLQDKDTIVRWSAAKAVARIAARLPTDFANQVLDTLMGLFAIHSIAAASLYDLPAIAESTWHGACLACAEMARRGLVSQAALPTLIEWLSKALYFDIRKGAHSIGSNVRDSAAYVLWALARAQAPSALAPHASNLARHLVTVALYDREIHIRRAASAAFQEHVGRTSLFPHGIDVLRKTDFYAVSVRRNAFLVAAPQVAEHEEYRGFLFDHLLNVTARHWDVSMRQLGAQSLRLICTTHLPSLGPLVIARAVKLLESPDTTDLHGALLALTEISIACSETILEPDERERKMRQAFACLALIPESILLGSRNDLVTGAACGLLARTITRAEIDLQKNSAVPNWRKLLDYGLKHRNAVVQEAAAGALGSLSKLVDCAAVVNRLIREMKGGSFTMQQSLGRVLGVVDYDAFPACLPDALRCLSECVGPKWTVKMSVEGRQNCYAAIPLILRAINPRLAQHVSAEAFTWLLDTMLHGLEDYTIDERGDVGSWIRMACLRGLTASCEIILPRAHTLPAFAAYFPADKYHSVVAGILKQGVERLDNVRQVAGECLYALLRLAPPDVRNGHEWAPENLDILRELFCGESELTGWKDGARLFPKAVRLLDITRYRHSVLAGLVLSLGSKTESTHRPVAASLVEYSTVLPLAAVPETGYSLAALTSDLLGHARANLSSNSVVVPVLHTFNILLEAGALRRLLEDSQGETSLRNLHAIVTRNVSRLKNVQRITESMKIVVNLLSFPSLFELCVGSLHEFLAHEFPSIRASCAEYLYLVLQGADVGRETDEVEEVLLETEWNSASIGEVRMASTKVKELFLQ
ncbi:TBCD protein [Roridomyces roridus]|uniref:TBCD protein n=1 Tax=Roridomyces roridus TaxID=1738132 RepID=A0AAD7FX44_9AGAR|nr:TBCD protein [Roridomyces roridus]